MIDLHVHSIFSDGSFSPEQLVDMAVSAGLKAMALTDHDTIDGLDRFMIASKKSGLVGVTGVEISADVSPGTLHILGYFINHHDAGLTSFLKDTREGRSRRNEHIIQELNKLGFKITLDEVASYAGADFVGRPHFAMALEAKGYIRNKHEAFDKYLGKGKPAYAERLRLSPEDSIKVIKAAGGVAVIAHPFTLMMTQKELRGFCAGLKDAGLTGIEIFYPEHSRGQIADYKAVADELGLVATGGTDFHGAVTPDLTLGRGYGGLKVEDSVLERLESALKSKT